MRTVIKIPLHRSGVYLLKRKGAVVYVGKSRDIMCRFAGHKDKPFDEVEIRWMPPLKLDSEEHRLIKIYDPILNVNSKDTSEMGAAIREKREAAKVSLRALASALGITAPYLQDLERGRRNWTQERFDKAVEILNAI